MSLLDIIRQRLIDTGAATVDYPCWINYQPDQPDGSMAIVLTGGMAQDTHGNENLLPTFQVKIRVAKFDFAQLQAKCTQVYDALQDADMAADHIWLIQALASGPMTWNDELNRLCASYNFRVIIARNAS